MNPLLEVKLIYSSEKNSGHFGIRNLTNGRSIDCSHLDKLISDLKSVLQHYQSMPVRYIKDILIDVRYNDIIAKSSRMRRILKNTLDKSNNSVVGARFTDNEPINHIITHYVTEEDIRLAIGKLAKAKEFVSKHLNGKAEAENFNEVNKKDPVASYGSYDKKEIRDLIVDASLIEAFTLPGIQDFPEKDDMLITFYHTEVPVHDLLQKIGIETYQYLSYGKDTISVQKDVFFILSKNIPYLISMISSDLSKHILDQEDTGIDIPEMHIPSPSNEPVIGVIDTVFDTNVYFKDWVDYHDYREDYQKLSSFDEKPLHGAQVTSIIVDGPSLNKDLDDGCGRFKVRHFGVCANRISIPRLVSKIQAIVSENPDIHVWNLSLGTEEEVNKNFISYDSYILDSIQADKNVIFIVAGTNDSIHDTEEPIRIGSPADSINSLVVNSVKRDGTPASYSRKGPVLSFYGKPDIAYYGGDEEIGEYLHAYSHKGIDSVCGTSFAAPWISRKMCYLIDIIGLPREVAKALVIDSATGWDYNTTPERRNLVGYGVVPVHIQDIVQSNANEIRFILHGTANSYKTLNKAIPIPRDSNDFFPFIAKATLCYFPECERSQGVDYTSRELSFKFGRIDDKENIKDIHGNTQDNSGEYSDERKSRKDFRKWDNTKFIATTIKKNNQPLKSYSSMMWGISIVSKERLKTKMKKGLNFGIVITLKELYQVNRIQDFINACQMRGYIVNSINIQNRIHLQQSLHENIQLDD